MFSQRESFHFLSKDSSDHNVRQDIHDHRCHAYADYDCSESFFPVDAKEGCDKSSGPGSGSRKRDSYKEYQPQNSYLLIRSLLLIAFFSSFSTSGRKRRVLRSHAKIGRIRSRINGIGIRFPTRQIGIARQVGIFKNAGPAARIPPLSSRIGIIEIIK